jgi:hypothetical protein
MIRATPRGGMLATCFLALLATALALPASAQQGEPARMKRAGPLRDAPGDNARVLAALALAQPVTRLGERQGPWIRVDAPGQATGWVHMFDVGPAAGPAAPTASDSGNALSGGLRGLTTLLRGRQAAPTVATSTIGIRGLEAEDLARSQPDLSAVGRMEQLRQGEAVARDFAARSALVAARVEPLPAPRSSDSGAADGANNGSRQP